MNILKSLILGSSAALIVAGGANAADLPVKAKAVEYVKICSIYGAGFYYIPGSDTCIKLGGYVLIDAGANQSFYFGEPAYNGNAGQGNRLRNPLITESRADLTIDTRTASEYGTVRTYADLTFNWSNAFPSGVAGGNLGVFNAFIQFAGFTVGKAYSAFAAPWNSYPGNLGDSLVGGGFDNFTGVNQLTYTAQFGNGVSATVSAQDPSGYSQSNLYNTSGAANIPAAVYGSSGAGGIVAPDLIGQFQVDQAWGLFQTAVAAHDNHTSYYGTSSVTGHPNDVWGFAAEASLKIKNIPTGPGDTITIDTAYGNGASKYVFSSLLSQNFAMYGNAPGFTGSAALVAVTDGVFAGTSAATGTSIALTTAYGIRGAFNHNWNPNWSSALFGGYGAVRYNTTGASLVCANFTPLLTAGSTCNPNFSLSQVGVNTTWTPVKNLSFAAEVMYSKLHQNDSGAIVLPASGTNPAGTYSFKDQSTVEVEVRAIRTF